MAAVTKRDKEVTVTEISTVKKIPETPTMTKPSGAVKKRVVVNVDASTASDSLAAKEAALKELQRQIKADKEELARKHAKNVKTLEDNARSRLYPSFFPSYRLPQNKVVADALKMTNKTLLSLRGQFTTAMNEGRVKDALALLQRAVEVQNGNLIEPPKGPIWGGQKDGQKEGQEAGR